MNDKIIEQIVQQVVAKLNDNSSQTTDNGHIPIGVSARHVHLQKDHIDILFGKGYQLTKRQDLSQPGQFAANETLVVAGPKGSLERVRVLGPARSMSQVEVSMTDAFKLGVKPPLRESGDIEGSSPATLIGPKGSVYLDQGLIIAQAHIHMHTNDAVRFNVTDGEFVRVLANTARPLVFDRIKIRVSDKYRLEMHIDTDEGNAALVSKGTYGRIIRVDETDDQMKRPLANVQTEQGQNVETNVEFKKRLLSKESIEKINAKTIHVKKHTIVTALAKDYAREKDIEIKVI